MKVSFTKQEVIDILRSQYNLSSNVEIVIEEQQQESHKVESVLENNVSVEWNYALYNNC